MSESKSVLDEQNVVAIVAKLQYALAHERVEIQFQENRVVDYNRDIRYTNQYTVANLFPDEDPVIALKRELKSLKPTHYLYSVKDLRFPKKSLLHVFAMKYDDYVYIKIRVELLTIHGEKVFVMSFHYSSEPLEDSNFPYL
ncbi:MAG: hypothetical protein JXB08_02500 [Bacilli bacterium]|nr:hypothetical protein [Bacilli bacterium]MBN2876945.1 hypothetical protein [Bacilli bacterium]